MSEQELRFRMVCLLILLALFVFVALAVLMVLGVALYRGTMLDTIAKAKAYERLATYGPLRIGPAIQHPRTEAKGSVLHEAGD